MNDNQIVELFWQRDEQAICETSARYGPYCHAIANNILSSWEDAEECVNDTWMKAWTSMPPQHPCRLRMFLAKITRGLSIDKLRRQSAKKRGNGELPAVLEELEECLPDSSNVEAELQARELGREINRFLYGLPKRDCNVFLRRYFYVEPVTEIARRYGLKEGNVWVILSRTRRKLQEALRKGGYLT